MGTPAWKISTKKSRFCGTTVHGTLFGPDGLLRSKMVWNMFFGPLTISYDAWMMSHTKLKKLFLRLKIGPKMTPRATFPLGFRGKIFQKKFWPKIASKDTSSTCCSRPKKLDQYMHPLGTQGVLKIFCQNPGFTRKWKKWVSVPGGCIYLGWGAGQTKFHIIPPCHINISF